MATEIVVPRIGWSMDEGTFSQWLKRDGDVIKEGEAIYELESDKATQEVESFDAGVLRIGPKSPKSGDTVKVGQVLAYLCAAGERAPFESTADDSSPATAAQAAALSIPASAPVIAPTVRRQPVDAITEQPNELGNGKVSPKEAPNLAPLLSHSKDSLPSSPADNPTDTRVKISPRAARAAIELGVSLAGINGSGREGRIRETDILAARARQTSSPLTEIVDEIYAPLPIAPTHVAAEPIEHQSAIITLRRTIAARMVAATQQAAPVTLSAHADASNLNSFREQSREASKEGQEFVPRFADLFVKLSAAALERHPTLMHQWSDAGIRVPDGIHIAVAVDTPQGLYAPVLRNVDSLSLLQVSDLLHSLSARARARQLSPAELDGGTFTVTNLGRYRVDAFTPIINLPQTAILGVGQIVRAPAVVGNSIAIRHMVTLSLTFDHRVVDGAAAAALLTTICDYVERPFHWLLT